MGDKGARGMVGSSLRPRKRRFLLSLITVVAAVAFVVVPLASTANPDISGFELDGNTVHNSATTPPDDWNTLFDASGNPTGAGSAIASSFTADPTDSTDLGFTQGGSKDTNDVSQWLWQQAQVTPAKDNIGFAYTAT